MAYKLLFIVILATVLINFTACVSRAEKPDDNVLTQNKAYAMKVESMSNKELKLYDKVNKINISLQWHCDAEDLKQLKRGVFYYNHKDDVLYMILDYKLYNLNDDWSF